MKKLFLLLLIALLLWWAWSYYSQAPVEFVDDVDATLNSFDTADLDKELQAVDAEINSL